MSISHNSQTNDSMDFFAEAVIKLHQEKTVNFEFEFEINGQKIREKHDLSRYLRKECSDFMEIEKKLIGLCHGKVLDVGSGTGNYLEFIKNNQKVLNVLGLELSSKLVNFGNKIFGKNMVQGDFFEYNFGEKKFDTITLLENNIGICKSPEKLNLMIDKIGKILNSDGQILIVTKKYNQDFSSKRFNQITLTPYLNNQKGEPFIWITFDENYLAKEFNNFGFKTEEIYEENQNLLLQITRKN